MKENLHERVSQRSEEGLRMDDSFVCIDLPSLMDQIKEEKSWKDGKRNAITAFKSNKLRIILIALHENSEMARHVADGVISVKVLEGRMQFNTDQQSVELGPGQMLVLHEELFHSVIAIQQTIFLLTVTNSFSIKWNHL